MPISPNSDLLEARGISKSFGGNKVLENVDFTLKKGELVCLLGVSGAGKTTLFNILSGLMTPDCGQVLLNGESITGRPGKISYMLQKDLLLPYRTVVDNIAPARGVAAHVSCLGWGCLTRRTVQCAGYHYQKRDARVVS